MKKQKANNAAIEEKKAKLKEAMDMIANMTEEARQEMLQRLGAVVTCEGHACSVQNTILLYHQNHTVSVVGGYRQWLAKGRQVRQGERCLYIFAPVKRREADLPPPGKPDENEKIRMGMRFHTAAVFDIAQTDPVEVEVAHV